ncbi:MAG: hypothetical protein ABW024_04035 [Microbacterium sp.]
MSLRKDIERIRTDADLSPDERVWKALDLIARRVDDNDADDILGAIFDDL